MQTFARYDRPISAQRRRCCALVGCVALALLSLLATGCASSGEKLADPNAIGLPEIELPDLTSANLGLPEVSLAGGGLPIVELPKTLPSPRDQVNGAFDATSTKLASLSRMKQPTNDGDWVDELKVLPYATGSGDKVTIHNIRDCEFFSYRDCIVKHFDRSYKISDVETVDFVVVPFNNNRAIAHTMLSFGMKNGDHLGVSAEVRLEKGEQYDAALGLFGQFELTYVIATEEDLIPVRTNYRECDVYVYRSTATPRQSQLLFVDVLKRVNGLKEQPEFYDTLSNNCTTNIVRHINAINPGLVPHDYRVLLPGFADQLAYDLKLIDTSAPFTEIRRRSRVTDLANRYQKSPDFSARIRSGEVLR